MFDTNFIFMKIILKNMQEVSGKAARICILIIFYSYELRHEKKCLGSGKGCGL